MNTQTIKLCNGIGMLNIGLGVYKTKEEAEVKQAVKKALETGYRMIDTASTYKNEIGEAIRE
ncbi:aldo/keto reductase [Xenorhabdus miraniensis]|uniref:2,5-didehydrogluconate reductase A n=1 Tax=Xenorhabdus miraniensis TaxID=351674 RepID=A0A2D0JPB8_9GAMM|nr:aldo/keto reductase [Xenorhabdus miraniensis]PHM48117.1 2,5-didehydrogluconate reductase A [Xenorhabdus miraniensis]